MGNELYAYKRMVLKHEELEFTHREITAMDQFANRMDIIHFIGQKCFIDQTSVRILMPKMKYSL